MILLVALILIVLFLMPTYERPVVLPNIVSRDESEYIKRMAIPLFRPSTVGGNHQVNTNIRQSETAWLDLDDPVVRRVAERCLQHVDRPLLNCEKLQVLRYRPGGFYKPHYDVFSDDPKSNPRMYTFILALNEEYDGGATAFPRLKREYRLRAGDGLLFENLDNYEFMTGKAYHGGKPVERGEKWVCNLWVHKYPYLHE